MIDFEKKWVEHGEKTYFFARPYSTVTSEDWMSFFRKELKNFFGKELLLLLDIKDVDDQSNLRGFQQFLDLIKEKNIKRSKICAVSRDPFLGDLARIFETLAETQQVNLKTKIMKNQIEGEAWLCKTKE